MIHYQDTCLRINAKIGVCFANLLDNVTLNKF